MGISISRLLGAGLLAFGVLVAPTAMIGATGVAYANAEGDAPADTTSADTTEPDTQDPAAEPAEEPADDTDPPADDLEPPAEEPVAPPDAEAKSSDPADEKRDRDADEPASPMSEQVRVEADEDLEIGLDQPTRRSAARTAVVQVSTTTSGITAAPEPAPTAAAQAAAAPAGPNLINIIGTLFFGAFDNIVRFFEGPPVVPPGRAVRIARTPLELDCGDGRTVDADWYFPTETTPDKIIYFQHGGFARAGLYNVTAADLAVKNNAIVVAPSITSNFFECFGCQMGADQMHAAVAKLFFDDRGALTTSALAAGWTGALPSRFVIAGHSEGGQLAAGAAGFYARGADPDRVHDLAGVLLLDTSPVGGAVERGVRSIPLDIPVHHISAAPSVLNGFGDMDKVLGEIRPGFVGLQLIGGVHADAWQSSNGLGKLIVGLAFGFSTAPNAEAVQNLSQAWISDWFNGTHTDAFYGDRGEVISIDTPEGTAQAYVIPGPAPTLTIIDRFLKSMIESTVFLRQFSGNCAVDPNEVSITDESLLVGRISTADTALSLDGRRQTGQSVGQQCM